MGSFTFKNGNYEIKNYERCKTFASFLPGISGTSGIPMWTFYVNRGQCITGFGVKDKNEPMMEFSPAAIAYKDVYTRGFRTFIRKEAGQIIEPFGERHESQTMDVSMSGLKISETRDDFKISVAYCNVPNMDFAGLVRKVTIENISGQDLTFECLDGIPEILPFGIKNEDYKAMGNLLRSWMDVENMEQQTPYFKLRASTEDEAEVSTIERGHFSLSWDSGGHQLPVIVDMENIFGQDTSLRYPEGLDSSSVEEVFERVNVTANKLPGHFTGCRLDLKSGASHTIYSLFGHTSDIDAINRWVMNSDLCQFGESCFKEARDLIDELTGDIATRTGHRVFDQYCRQSYLDNLMRGGYPLQLGKKKEKTFYVYSRKHGDQERDYNFFSIAPEFYSQGNGNFRDVNQNRRNDVFFHPEIGAHNIKLFFDLIQLDGYNPLVIEGQYFTINEESKTALHEKLEAAGLAKADLGSIEECVSSQFSPGELYSVLNKLECDVKDGDKAETLFAEIMSMSQGLYTSRHGEGFWSDHWTYNLDLVEGYLYVYPDRLEELLLYDKSYKFYDSPYRVLPRKEKIKVVEHGIRQYDAAELDREKLERLGRSETESHWARTDHGKGEILETSLMAKMVSLVANKFSLLDPMGMGIEMEAGKPGWNDALNGLPGLFGSSMAEQVELHRLVKFLLSFKDRLGMSKASEDNILAELQVELQIELPVEVFDYWNSMISLLQQNMSEELTDMVYWDLTKSLLESYREHVRFGVSGKFAKMNLSSLMNELSLIEKKLSEGIENATLLGEGLLPTFLTFDFEALLPKSEWSYKPLLECVALKEHAILPHFLEGPARQLKTMSYESGSVLHEKVKASNLYDREIRMYKTSLPLDDETHEIGRIRAFTPGWLERESVFLHMEYKYLLALLKSGQYESFFEEAKNALIPFLDPATYGRPTTENVSFIASSMNPDPSQHGRGHIARLSGSTAEFIHMWTIMMVGDEPFDVKDGKLTFKLSPKLPSWLFDENGQISFRLFGKTQVTYINPLSKSTFGEDCVSVSSMTVEMNDGELIKSDGCLYEAYADGVRSGKVKRIEVHLS